jgi:hypothetical protein
MVSPTAKGIWIDLLCYCWESPTRGCVTGEKKMLAKMTGASEQEFDQFLAEAERYKFCDICVTSNGIVTVGNRRMMREDKARKQTAMRQARHRAKQKK